MENCLLKTLFKITLCLLLLCGVSFSQFIESENVYKFKHSKTADAGNTLILGSILVLTPTLVIEGGKSHFGLSKALSLGKYPYGRVEADYTYIFRSERSNALHLSYNIDIPTNGKFNDPSLFFISPGGGYYTDFTRKGYFAQLAFGLWAGVGFADFMSIHPNIKVRKVFMQDNQPGVFELSLGVGFGIFSR